MTASVTLNGNTYPADTHDQIRSITAILALDTYATVRESQEPDSYRIYASETPHPMPGALDGLAGYLSDSPNEASRTIARTARTVSAALRGAVAVQNPIAWQALMVSAADVLSIADHDMTDEQEIDYCEALVSDVWTVAHSAVYGYPAGSDADDEYSDMIAEEIGHAVPGAVYEDGNIYVPLHDGVLHLHMLPEQGERLGYTVFNAETAEAVRSGLAPYHLTGMITVDVQTWQSAVKAVAFTI